MAHVEKPLRQLLYKIATEQKFEHPEIIINEMSSGGANYTSKLFTVVIREEDKEDLRLFAKVATLGPKFRSEVPECFDTERFAYTNLAKVYASLEEENGVPEEHRLFFTKCYGFDPTKYQETVVMEDLLAQGYGPYDRFHSFDWEYATSATTDLAKMHALSFAFCKKNPEEFENTLEIIKMDWKEGAMDGMMQNSAEIALMNVSPKNKEALEKFLRREEFVKDLFVKMCATVRSTAIIHADFRGSNLLHRVREDGKVDIKIVDLQTIQGGCPVTDLIYFIFTGSDEEFRAKYFKKLLDHYYTQLSAAMRRLNLEPEETFSREDFDFELKEGDQPALTAVRSSLPRASQVDEEDFTKVERKKKKPCSRNLCGTALIGPNMLLRPAVPTTQLYLSRLHHSTTTEEVVQYLKKLPFGLSVAVFTLPVGTVDSENAPEVNDDLEISNLSLVKTSDVYPERLNGVVNDYVKWGILK